MICQINHFQNLVVAFINQMYVIWKSLSENMISHIYYIQPFVNAFTDQMHAIQKWLSEYDLPNQPCQRSCACFIDQMHTVWKSLSENMIGQINHFQDIVHAFIAQMYTVRKNRFRRIYLA